jgi:putative tryptophan/tyrosine transport system substrate-binding protein
MHVIKRRDFLMLLGGVAVCVPRLAAAEASGRVRHIGILMSGAETDPETQARVSSIQEGLSRFGWSEGRNIQINYRYAAADPERAQQAAKELVTQKPEVIVATATHMAAALQRETQVVPIVFIGVVDPIGSGLIAGLARPGGNLTGTLLNEESVASKWVAMLKEMAPSTERVAVLSSSKMGFFNATYGPAAETAAKSLGIELVAAHFADAAELQRNLEAFAQAPNGALLVPPDLPAVLHRDLIVGLAAKHRLPAVYQARFWVLAGGLMSYGADRAAAHRQAGYYVDRILNGAKPADLPVQAPTKYETTLNLRTAKALGVSVPPGLLVAADEVIE